MQWSGLRPWRRAVDGALWCFLNQNPRSYTAAGAGGGVLVLTSECGLAVGPLAM